MNMKSNKTIVIALLVMAAFVVSDALMAQCAMCKATAASDLKNGGTLGKGLNFGILYLMIVPYIILVSLAFLFFRKQIAEKFRRIKK